MRTLFLLLPLLLQAQTSNYPGALDTNTSLFVTADNVQSSLTVAMTVGATTATVSSGTGFATNQIATVCDTVTSTGKCTAFEHMLITGVAGSTLTVTRGFAGTSARAHAATTLITLLIDAAHQAALKSAVINIETALGTNLSNVSGYSVTRYNFASQAPGGSLIAGGVGQAITLTPCPAGVAGADSAHYLYLSGGTGTAEATLITGGTCTSGATTGTVTVTPANAHSGAWTVTSATFGLQEAVNAVAAAGGGTVTIPAGTYTPHATVTISTAGVYVQGAGEDVSIIQRTEDYGDTFVIGASAVAGISKVRFSDLTVTLYINYQTAGPSVVNKPTTFPDSAHFRLYGCTNCWFERMKVTNMPYEFVVNGGSLQHWKEVETQGVWDTANASCQITKAAYQLNNTATQAYPVQTFLTDNFYRGYSSASRSVTINGSPFTQQEFVGPRYMVEVKAAEALWIKGGEIGGAADYNVYLNLPLGTTNPLLEVWLQDLHDDGARLGSVGITNNGNVAKTIFNVHIQRNIFNGETCASDCNGSLKAISVLNPAAGLPSVSGLTIANNQFFQYGDTAISLLDGVGLHVTGNSIRAYNIMNAFSAAANSSGIYIGGRATEYEVVGNQIGGGVSYEAYGVGSNHCVYGLQVASLGTNGTGTMMANTPPFPTALGNVDYTYYSILHLGADMNLWFEPNVTVTGSTVMACLNDAAGANCPLEFRGTKAVFMGAPISAPGVNYIASETGANNAIAGCLTDISLTAGISVTVKLAHTLQAGANTFNYCAGGAVNLKSSRNVANNIATAYAATGTITLQYDGAEWVDLSQ